MKNIGWIGLGKMGLPMALKLADQKYNLSVFNRTKSKTVGLVTAGARAEENVVNVAKSSDIIIIATNHSEFKDIKKEIQNSKPKIIYDVWNLYNKDDFSSSKYLKLGMG